MTQLFTDAGIPLQANEDPYRNLIRIFNSGENARSFSVFTNNDLKKRCNNTWTGEYYMTTNPQSVNDMMANSEGSMTIYNASKIFEGGQFSSLPNQSVYILCPQLGNFRSMGPQGERDILKKHVVQADPLEVSIDTLLNAEDCTDISKRSFKSINFRLTDVNGNTVPLHGQNISFTLVFSGNKY
jgi:hypothetical protein